MDISEKLRVKEPARSSVKTARVSGKKECLLITSARLEKAFAPIAADLRKVQLEIARQAVLQTGGFKKVLPVLNYFFNTPGKFLRSGLTLLTGRMIDPRGIRKASVLASVSEMIHSASLIHDDIVDQAGERRGRKSLNALFGNQVSVLAGDLLFTQSLSILQENFKPELLKLYLGSVKRMCTGEITHLRSKMRSFRDYELFIESKTSSLMECSCMAGALAAGASSSQVKVLGSFGLWFGTAYQLVDDHNDDDVTLSFKLDRIATAQKYADRAVRALRVFPDSPYKQGLVRLANALMESQS